MEYVDRTASAQTAATNASSDASKTEPKRYDGSIIVGARTGGIGKTTLAQVILYALQLLGYEATPVSVDAASMTSTSKLKKVLPETRDVRFAPSLAELADNPAAALQHLDELAPLLARGGSVLDLGANLAPQFLDWTGISALKETIGVLAPAILVVPTTAQPQAISDAVELIQLAKRHTAHFPIRKAILVMNEKEGPFSSTIAGFGDIAALLKDRSFPVRSLVLPELRSEIWSGIQAHAVSFARVIDLSPRQLEEVIGIPFMQCGRGKRFFMIWLEKAINDLGEIGLLG